MTTTELHKILDDESKKLSVQELEDVIYELEADVGNKILETSPLNTSAFRFYVGENNAFRIVLDLLEHVEVS